MGCDCKDGERGPIGPQGAKGDTGATGAKGDQGIPGTTGATGPQGAKGDKGDTGAKGDKGDKGDTGATGAPGAAGANGTNGVNGTDGVDGDPGNGIASIVWTSNSGGQPQGTQGTTDTYTITFDDATTTTFIVTNGNDGCATLGSAFLAEAVPANINATAAALGITDLCDAAAVLQVIAEIYDDATAYDPATGIWTVPESGRYDISFFANLTIATGWSAGRLKAGLVTVAGCTYLCSNYTELNVAMEKAQVAGTAIGVSLTAGEQIVFKIVNVSTTNYVSTVGDKVRFSARKVG